MVLSAALNAHHLKSEGGMDCPAWASSAAASREEPGALESGHCWSVLAGDRATLQEVPGLLQDPGHHVAREIGIVFVSYVEMFDDRKILFSFLMWVKCGV